jgi:superfamily II DNA or RNA helicase
MHAHRRFRRFTLGAKVPKVVATTANVPGVSTFAQFETRGFELLPWQHDAVNAWSAGEGGNPFRGTLEIFTGGGKTLIALDCAARAAIANPAVRVVIVVPTEALARQWLDTLVTRTVLGRADVGLLGAGSRDGLIGKRALVAVLNSAARHLPEMARQVAGDLLLIVDECHRAGAPSLSRVLQTPARFRLGLSATPDREEIDEDGEPLEYDEQLVGQSLGGVVYRYGLREARLSGWLPDFNVQHYGLQLQADERAEYDRISRQIDDLADRLADHGAETSRARTLMGRPDEVGALANSYVAATAQRKDRLYRAGERERVTDRLVLGILARRPDARILLFHERVDEASRLYERLREAAVAPIGLEHSRLGAHERAAALSNFRDGSIQVLVSVKSLVEGIDVPAADIGISVASSSSVRQRIQALGRVLRRTFDGPAKLAEMHVLYIANTVDELIYAKEDWADLTGEARNGYWFWPLGAEQPETRDWPPRTPHPTEEQEWQRLGGEAPQHPEPWLGTTPDREYSVDTRATVRTRSGAIVANPQETAELVRSVRGRPGGRFFVTRAHRLVLVREGGSNGRLMVAGQLQEPFSTRNIGQTGSISADAAELRPGDPYPGPAEASNGEFRVLQKRGGVIQRSLPGTVREFALTDGAKREQILNAQRVLDAWRKVSSSGLKIAINRDWHAWYLDGGLPRFLAEVPEGFAWPTSNDGVL